MKVPIKVFDYCSKKELVDIYCFSQECLNALSGKNVKMLLTSLRTLFHFDYSIGAFVEFADHNHPKALSLINESYPLEWINIYQKNSFQRIDPIFKSHISKFIPQVWSETYRKEPDIDSEFIFFAQEYGLCDGVSFGVKEVLSAQGSIFSFSGVNKAESDRIIIILKMIVPFLHMALRNYYYKNKKLSILKEAPLALQLSKREIEVLNWLKIGKTNWEISRILNISEHTVKFHVNSIQGKLHASTRGYAIAKAMQLELISL